MAYLVCGDCGRDFCQGHGFDFYQNKQAGYSSPGGFEISYENFQLRLSICKECLERLGRVYTFLSTLGYALEHLQIRYIRAV